LKRRAFTAPAIMALAFAAPSAATSAVPSSRIADVPLPPAAAANLPVGLLVDVNSGRVLYARNADRRFAPASMAKVMTLYVAFEEIAAGRLTATRRFTVADETARQWNGRGTSLYLKAGRAIDVDTLLRGIATVSANDAAVVLAQGYAGDADRWCALMNTQAQRLGMTGSHFATPNGWPDGGRTQVSAEDLVTLAQALVTRHPDLYRRYVGQKRMTFDGVEQASHDPTVGVVRGADGIKTGHTREAGYNFLGSAARDGRRLILVVGGARSEAERASASRALLEWGFAAWRARPLFARGAKVAEARVQNGAARSVPLITDRAIDDVLPTTGETTRDSGAHPTVTLTYQGPLVAPIAQGAKVAELRIGSTGGVARRLPLYAGVAVDRAGHFDRLMNGIMSLIP
jgi:D-alanyl-D-alanine carboxypeptidase (penicillin-binding protein 5/6)